jgi:hypothetical protein
MSKVIYGLFAYDSEAVFLASPQEWHSACYATRLEDLPAGGFAVQDGSFEVIRQVTVPASSPEATMAGVKR